MHPEDATYITPMCNWVPAPWHLTVLWDPREQLTILSLGYRSSREVQWKGVSAGSSGPVTYPFLSGSASSPWMTQPAHYGQH